MNAVIRLTDLDAALTPEQRGKLEAFAALLLDWNQRFNLTSAKDQESLWFRHIIDSLSISSFIPDGAQVIDVGSGGGFPAIPLALLRPDLSWTLVESTGKKARFLEAAGEDLGLESWTVLAERVERLGQSSSHRQRYDVVTSRAVARLPVLLEYTLPLAKIGGKVLAMKGAQVMDELDESLYALQVLGGVMPQLHIVEDQHGEEAGVLDIPKEENTPREFPREVGVPGQFPLMELG